MPHSTPFFQGFSSILFGRPALSEHEKTLRKVAQIKSLAELFATFGDLIPEALLQRRANKRLASGVSPHEFTFRLPTGPMARPLRFQYSGAVYNVMARGDGGDVVFETDDDRKAFLSRLGEVCESTAGGSMPGC